MISSVMLIRTIAQVSSQAQKLLNHSRSLVFNKDLPSLTALHSLVKPPT